MADLYAPQTQFLNTNGGQSEQQAPQGITGNADVDAYLSSLPESERNAALERLTAPPSADEIGEMVKGGYNPTFEEFDAVEAWHKNHEVNIIDGIGAGIEQVMGDLGRAVGAVADHPMDVLSKSPANVIEAFSQGTRNFYGMAAQSADPTSKLFRFKNFLNGNGTKEERYNQYMEALAFNRHSAELMEGKTTLVMDKDMINPEVVQAASYIADPTLFIPFGQAASAGMRVVGLGEKMMLAGAKASAIKNAVIGGTLKWGVGAPVEFLGGAVRNTIDFGINQGARAIEATTGIGAKEIAQTARLSGVPMSAASFAGHSIPYAGAVSEAYVGASAARGLGEAVTAIGDTMLKNKAFGRGINSWAREALENTPNLSGHAKGLLKVLDAVDPAFTYGAAVTQGAAHGAMIGGTLGYLSGGEEGFAHGLGAGIALGGVGGGVGKGVADVTNQTLYGRVAVQRKMTIEGLKALGTTEATNKAMAFEALVKAAEFSGDRHYMAHIDGMIAGVDKVAPRSKWFVRSRAEHIDWLLKQEIDPTTGKLIEGAKLFPEFGSDRKARGRALGFLSLLGDQFAGVPDNLIKHLATLPQDHALRKAFFRLSGEQKAAVFEAIKNNANPEFRKALGETQGVERVSDANYDKWVKDNYEYFDPSNPENNAVKLREKLKQIDGSTLEGKKEVNSILERIKHIEEVKKQYNDWANSTTPETRAKADAAMQDAWKGRGSRQMAEPIKPQKANKPKIAEYYGDINYGEMQTARVNELFAKGDIDGARKLIGTFLKDNTNKDGSLNTRGRILRNKLAADGYFDKDGNLRPRRYTDNDAQPTAAMYGSNEGFVLKRDATGEIEVHISLDNITKDGVAHELFHAIFKESVLKPDFIDRLSKDLIGTFDKDGKLVKAGSVRRNEIREFFRRYIDLTTDKESDFRDEMARLESAIKEFETGSEAKTISPDTIAVLHAYAEEFGAYYFQNWLRAQSPDFLFRGGKLEGVRGIMDGVKNGWLDFWERTMQSKDPTFDFKSLKEGEIDKGFKTVNGKRVRVSSLDYFMRDFVRATSDTNRGNFDINKLSPEGQAHYIQSNGLRNTHRVDSTGRAVRLSRREAARANAVAGKEIYKILKGINPNRAVDGDGNFIGRLSDAELDAIVKSGHAPRAWANKLRQAYEILDGNQSNVVEFGYHGKTEQLTDASYPRLYGEDVSFKHRKAILLDVELKVGEKGTFYALFHTLDKSVIEARGDNLWKDSAVQALWDGNRGSMEQDFFRYLENASKKDGDQSKKESSSLWVDGKGAQRRDVLHQMLGMAKNEGDTYLNKPIAEIPLGIRHSVTTFNNDGVSSFRVSGTERYKYNHDNAFRLLSRNWKPSEMKAEKTGLGEIITHASGYKFVKDSRGIYRAYDDEGAKIGEFNTIEQAAKAGESSHKQKVTAKQNAIEKAVKAQDKIVAAKKPASSETRREAILKGDQFDTDEVRAFTEGIDNKNILRQTRDEHIYQRAEEALSDPAALLKLLKERYQSRSSLWDKYDVISKQRLELYNAKEALYKEKTVKSIRRQNDMAAKWGQNYEAMKMSQEYFDHIRLDTEEKAQFAELQNKHHEAEVIEMDFKDKYKVELAEDGIRTVLKEVLEPEGVAMTDKEKADMLVKLVQANTKQKRYHGLLEELFAVDYDDKIQTGVPFVTRTVHGTNNVQLLFSRMFDNKMLASRHGETTTSSTLGVFSGGSQNTSLHYAGRPTPAASNISLAGALRKFFANTNRREMYNPDGSLTPYGHAYDSTEALLNRFNAQEERHIRTLYDSYTRIHQKARDTYDKFFVDGEWKSSEEADKYFGWTKMLRDTKAIDFTGNEISGVKDLLPLDEYLAGKKGTFAEMFGIGDKTHQEISPIERSSALDMIREDIARNLEQSKEVPELFGMVGTKDVPMQTRQLVRMNNPYVVTDPRSYSEYWISPHMKRAIAGGHDGIVFKRFDDGGGRDNVYAVFSEFSDEQIKIMETSFDDEFLPLGKDESGRVLKNGKELGLAMKPVEWTKDLYNYNGGFAEALGSGRIMYGKVEDLADKTAVTINPDNSLVGVISADGREIFKGQGGVFYSTANDANAGLWASNQGAASKLASYINNAIDLDIKRNGMLPNGKVNPDYKPTVYLTLAKAEAGKILTSENGARGAMNVLEKMRDNGIIPDGVFRDSIVKALTFTEKKTNSKIDINKTLTGDALTSRLHELFFSRDDSSFRGRGFFIDEFVGNIAEAYKLKDTATKKNQFKDKAQVISDLKATFGEQYSKGFTKSGMIEAISELFSDPALKDVKQNEVYGAIKIQSKVKIDNTSAHDSYSHALKTLDASDHQLVLFEKPRNVREVMNTAEGNPVPAKTAIYTDAENKVQKISKSGQKVFKDYTADFGFSQEGAKVVTYKSKAGMQDSTGMMAKPTEANAPEGGRVYDQQGKQWKTGFIGRQSEENPELTKNVSLQHIDKANGVNKLVFTDNSTGESKNIGHITWDKFGGISTHISPEFRGRGLSYLFYSEAAERMRAQGIKQSVSTIVNKEAIPVKVREAIFGDTRRFISRTEEGKPIGQAEAKAIIAAMQDQGGEYAGVTVSNKIDLNARYKPREEVIQRAKEAGYKPTVYYHGTPKDFTEFKSDVGRTMGGREGATAGYFFFTPNEGEAKGIHGSASEGSTNVMQVFLKYENPFNTSYGKTPSFTEKQKARIIDFYRENASYAGSRDYLADVVSGYLDRKDLAGTFKYLTRPQRAELLKSLGFDSLIDKGNHIVVFDPEQIKSAKDFTYDDAGKEIPLSERFDKTKRDIRWKPVGYEGGDDYYKPKKNQFESKDDLGLLVRQFVIQDKDGLDIYNPDPNALSYVQIGHGQSNLGGYQFKNVEIKGKSHQVKDVMYFIDDKGKFVSQEMHPEATQTHSRYARENNLKTAMHPMGWNYADALQGRVEMPIYEKGKLVRRGVASIVDFGYDKINSASDVKKAKGTIAERLKISEEDFDLYLFGAKDEVKAQRGYGAKDNLPIKFKPAEGDEGRIPDIDFDELIKRDKKRNKRSTLSEKGNRKYTDEQFENNFIGRVAEENPKLVKGLTIEVSRRPPYFSKDKEAGKGNDNLFIHIKKGVKSLGTFTARQFGKTEATAIESNISKEFQGQGYGKLIYSEMAERLRSMGVQDWHGRVEDQLERPIAIRREIVDKQNARAGKIGWTDVESSVDEDGFKSSEVTSKLKKEAFYKPAEGWRDWKSESTSIGSVVKNTIGYVIMNQGNKFKVYNPSKVMVGIYTDLEQAKRRVQRDEPK